MNETVKIIECPRDAWQGLPAQIAPEKKAAYLQRLISAGFTHIDAVSFVSASAVPQMADSERVLEILQPAPQVEIIGIVVNQKGAQRAIQAGKVRTVGFPFSISEKFLQRNQRQTPEESLRELETIHASAHDAGLGVVAYLSMAFGNPYQEAWSIDGVMSGCRRLADVGVTQISLADTVGVAKPEQIAEVVAAVLAALPKVEIGVHLHARRDQAASHIRPAFAAGCRRFDAALGGFGGCPFAQDALVGNIPTEVLIPTLEECGAALTPVKGLDELSHAAGEIAACAQAHV